MTEHKLRRFLAPDLALALAMFTALYCVLAFNAPQSLFRDADSGWHIVTGERILNEHRLPQSDPYSFTRAGQPWFAWEWASDCAMALAYRKAGLPGVVWLFVLVIAAVTWLWFRLSWAVGGNFLFAAAFAAPMLSTANLHWYARPHLFGWVLLLAAIWYFEKAPPRFRARDAAVMIGAGALWANMHASFPLLPLMALIYAVAHFARPLIWRLETAIEISKGRWFLWAALLSGAATLLNPYGWNLHGHVVQYLVNGELLDRIGEFQSFNFHAAGSAQIMIALGIAGVGGVLALAERKLAHFLLTILFLAAALRSARALPIAALVLLPLANGAITDALRKARDLRLGLHRALHAFLGYSDRLRLLDGRFSGMAFAPVFAVLLYFGLQAPAVASHTSFPADQFPVLAANELSLLPQNIRLLAPDKYGGYLIFRFHGQRKVFFDGRSDFYGSAFIKQYVRLFEVRPGWQKQVDDFGFTHALLPNDYSLIPALQQIGWKIVFRDEVATLLAAPVEHPERTRKSGVSRPVFLRRQAAKPYSRYHHTGLETCATGNLWIVKRHS